VNSLDVSHPQDMHADGTRRKEETRTWISRWSDRQSSARPTSSWFGARTGEWDFRTNIRVVGVSMKLAYPCPGILYQSKVQSRDEIIDAP
jgi:hypothetical protein